MNKAQFLLALYFRLEYSVLFSQKTEVTIFFHVSKILANIESSKTIMSTFKNIAASFDILGNNYHTMIQ